MKRILSVILIVMVAFELMGCAAKPEAPENTPEETPESTIEATEEPSPSPSVEPVSDATIQINEGSSIMIIVSLTDGVLTGSAACMFDGIDLTAEFEYILATTLVFNELDIVNYSFIGMSGEDLISVIVEDGEQSEYSKLPSKYGGLETDNDRTMGYVQAISAALSRNTDDQSDSTQTPQPPEATEPVDSNITMGQRNALDKAKSYLSFSAFSYQGLVEQLEYEQFSHEDAVYAADYCGADWSEQALKKAKSYLDISAFSYMGLIEQLEYEGFTSEQATYGADNCSADWNEQAAKKAKSYLDISSFSRDGLIEQLEYEGFTHEQAVYGVEANGY